LDAILFTHEHKDHIAGLDDVRGFNYKQRRPMPLYGQQRVLDRLKVEFAYAFTDNPYPGVPVLELHTVTEAIVLKGVEVVPVNVMHHLLPIYGYRFGNFGYVTDGKTIAPAERDKLRGLQTLVINGLQVEEHNSHFTIAEVLEMIEDLKPERAYLTHISHRLGKHADVERDLLPPHVRLGYDGLKIEVMV
jgi:phosphoribosyl 1,2-cyclic phosphate phosphodiesterase